MRHRRRRFFAAPLVMVSAAGCGGASHPREADPFDDYAYVRTEGTACTYSRPEHCPKGARCNPPPPDSIECPPELGTATNARIGRAPGDHAEGAADACLILLDYCSELACAKPAACPVFAPLLPLQWTIQPAPDSACTLTAKERTGTGHERLDRPRLYECPPALPDHHGFIERATPDAPCVTCVTSPCDPATAEPIACPEPPPPPVIIN